MSKKNIALIAVLIGVVVVAYVSDKLIRSNVNLRGTQVDITPGILPETWALEPLPLRTPADRVDELTFTVDEDGVKEFKLEVSEFRWEYEPEHWVHVWGYNGQIPGPTIRVTEGDKIRVIVSNTLKDSGTTVHWHGVDVNWESDGVPNITQEAIAPGESYTYEFTATPEGTRWYHSHGENHITAAQQLDMGLSGAFIIEPTVQAQSYDREYVLMLDEWNILDGVNPAFAHIHGAAAPLALPDYNTFTINGEIFPYIDPLEVTEGERVLVRMVNAGTSAIHPMHLHGHNYEVIARDGNPLPANLKRNVLTLHPGETADIVIEADNPGVWLFHCHHVHHAAAGMITMLKYEGYEPVADLEQIAVELHEGHDHSGADAGGGGHGG